MKPYVGAKVAVVHQVAYDKNGMVSGLVGASRRNTQIVHVYQHGAVRVMSGDTWRVRPTGNGQFATTAYVD